MSTKDYFDKDYYKILGVPKDAKQADIKKAFRKIARDNHPDAHPGNKKAEQRFKEASEAHDILSDTDKRKEYDDTRRLMGAGYRPGAGRTTTPGSFGFSDIFSGGGGVGGPDFSDLLGGLFGGGTRPPRPSSPGRARRGSDIEGEVSIDFKRAIAGATVSVKMVSDTPCAYCRGTGAKSGSVPKVCAKCQGVGVTDDAMAKPCPECRGRGLTVETPCPECRGSGRGASDRSMQVRIPAGVDDGQRIRIKGKGGAGENGGTPGDLHVTVHVSPHPVFARKALNLTVDLPVTYSEAALGAEIEVPTLGGMPVRLRIPPATPSGRTFRVRGKGVSGPKGERGDLLATVQIVVPPDLTADAKEALQVFQNAASESNPRADLLAKANA